ncbi:50S ribosomal protein L3 [Candidatus Babeliales bacterium]|nr:50S ribosomal protein L3 [Candidatus Babeliales bacterium]
MLTSLLGNKIGMTQLFNEERKVVPVTVVDVSNWLITQIKIKERDGYDALQIGKVKSKYIKQSFSDEWISKKRNYFSALREVKLTESGDFTIGAKVDFDQLGMKEGDFVDVSGTSKGLGFQGVIKRWNFSGGPKSHGSTFHKKPGSIGFLRRQGKVIKGQKLPGQCGSKRITVKGLEIVRFDKESGYLFIKGSVPGKKSSLVYISKQG